MGNNPSNERQHKQYRYSGARKAKKAAADRKYQPQKPLPPMPYTPPAPATIPPAPLRKAPSRSIKQRLITESLRDINDFYIMKQQEIGHGSFGIVREGVCKRTGNLVAIKTISKMKIQHLESLRSEIDILRSLNHPNIIKLLDVCEGPRHIHLVTEVCTGGELFDRIIARGCFKEADAAVIVQKLLSAVQHCHKRGVCHRDLKPENCLFETVADDAELKVIDFGLSSIEDGSAPTHVMKTRVGSSYYIAPEVLKGRYEKSCDLWSIGVITYILLSGYPPFAGDTDAQIFAAIQNGGYDFASAEWEPVSDEAKSLIRCLLEANPAKRYTADQALAHTWLTGAASVNQSELSTTILCSLRRFTGHNKLKKIALEVIADQLTESDLKELRQQFMAIDTDGNGVITASELADAVSSIGHGVVRDEVVQLLQGIDVDGDGLIDYPEFLAATVRRNISNQREHLINAFNYFDTRQQGLISKSDLIQFMGSEEQAQAVIDEVDVNGDGEISFEEFIVMMERKGLGEDASDEHVAEWEF